MIYSTELIIVSMSFAGLGVAGYVVHRMVKHVDRRIHLMLRASYHNTRDIKENLETVGVVRTETRKALEHQRVLLSSLNQQIKNLESTIGGENLTEHRNVVAKSETVAVPETVAPKTIAKVKTKTKREGLLGNLDDFLERGIEQIVANDEIHPARTKEMEIQVSDQQAAEATQGTNVAIEQVADKVEKIQKSVTAARRGGVISMNKLLQQQKNQSQGGAEKSEKIVKLSSIFANQRRVSAVDGGDEQAKKMSVG